MLSITQALPHKDGSPPFIGLQIRIEQYATEKPDAAYDITAYAGADEEFTLYQDDSETYGYERGECATIALRWGDENEHRRAPGELCEYG